MSFTGDATARPSRVMFTNLRTGETVDMPFTPTQFTESLTAEYGRKKPLGMSHSTLQYSGTTNHMFRGMDFFFRGTTPEEVDAIHDGRKFLMSLMYPSESADSVREGAPPRVLFIWPLVVSMTCVIGQLAITHVKFNRFGLTTVFRAVMSFEEKRDIRLTSEEVRIRGTQRSADLPIEVIDESLIGGEFD